MSHAVLDHATIIPLIGGEVLASDEVWKSRPKYIMTYSPFESNEKHLLNYYQNDGDNIPYIVLDKGGNSIGLPKVQVMSSVCPCAGLSQYHQKPGENNQNNQWMEKTAKYVLSEVRPTVFWGENAPGLVGKIGEFMLQKMRDIAEENGYAMSLYLTKNIIHGIPQFRKRTFYFFWNKRELGGKVPLFNYINRDYQKIEDLIASVDGNFQMEPMNIKTPSKDDPYYRYLLEVVYEGITHREFFEELETTNVRGNDVESLIERSGHTYDKVGAWMETNGYEREVPKCARKFKKLAEGGNIMRRGTIVPKDYIGAFVGHYPTVLTHPHIDRYVTYREAMSIMGLPRDFELLDPKKSINHICQNVPFATAFDMASEVKATLAGERNMIETDCLFQSNFQGYYEVWDKNETGNKNTLAAFL